METQLMKIEQAKSDIENLKEIAADANLEHERQQAILREKY